MSRLLPWLIATLSIGAAGAGVAQDTRDLGLPPPSGFQYPVLPPPSGSQNPILPPQSGQRYMPGVGGPFGEAEPRRAIPRRIPNLDQGLTGSVSPVTRSFEGEAVDRISEIGPAFRRCWKPPPMTGAHDGVMATVRFSLRRDGSIFGQPRVTWETRRIDPALKERFTASVLDAIRNCAPVRLSPRLGASIAGRPFTIRFHGRAPSNERPI